MSRIANADKRSRRLWKWFDERFQASPCSRIFTAQGGPGMIVLVSSFPGHEGFQDLATRHHCSKRHSGQAMGVELQFTSEETRRRILWR